MSEVRRIPIALSMALDPATTDEVYSNASGFTIVGTDPSDHWYVLVAEDFHGLPEAVIQRGVYYALRFPGIHTFSIEGVAAQKLYIPLFQAEFDKYGIRLTIKEYKYSTRLSKRARIDAMQPRFKQKKVHLLRGACDELERQLLRYPESEEDDLLDSLSQHLAFARPPSRYDVIEDDEDDDEEEDDSQGRRRNGTWVGRHGSIYAVKR